MRVKAYHRPWKHLKKKKKHSHQELHLVDALELLIIIWSSPIHVACPVVRKSRAAATSHFHCQSISCFVFKTSENGEKWRPVFPEAFPHFRAWNLEILTFFGLIITLIKRVSIIKIVHSSFNTCMVIIVAALMGSL